MSEDYAGPSEIAYARFPGRGISYHAKFEGRKVELAFSEKRKRLRIFVDGKEWKEVADG